MSLVKKGSGGSALDKLRRQKDIRAKIDDGTYQPIGKKEALVIAIDASASMLGWAGKDRSHNRFDPPMQESKWAAAVKAARMLIDDSISSSVGIVAFDHTCPSEAMMRVGSTSGALFSFLDEQAPRGGTCFTTALEASLNLIEAGPVLPVRRIILLSDGQDGLHAGLYHSGQIMERLIETKTIVDTVAFGVNADQDALQRISNATGGVCKSAGDAADLAKKFLQLEAGVRGLLSGGQS